ncbi:UDP-glucose:undecaprenyl-phosphate glucose-1-phosphate transferase [Novipirellula galeiformis]|uniref:UDP-glucose:undecaprenyl-phosphate glucose-1-phosphate transferase n=1 Tax=Novipirellula galeiformis TaxID=2528004 RepID=A0A5C6CUB0_9BACT|nr:undecaprenyl-phosphate glucose phosphotransferase [Novipirellula galeiformis]TWU26626.1 UDP-glucose:undecaprenyl-phosphate glucose-1-phosphate transferase [Novipirellula galeiformis]
MRLPILPQRQWWDFVQPCLDAAGVMASLALVKWIARGWVDDTTLVMGLIAVIVFLLSGHLTGLYGKSHSGSANTEMSNVASAWCMTILGLALLGYATRYAQEFARSVMLAWIILAPTVIGLGRMCLRIVQQAFLQRGIGTRRIAIAGLNELGIQVATNVAEDPSLGFQLVGFFDDRNELRSADKSPAEFSLSGNLSEMIQHAREGKIDTIFITLPMRAENRIRYLLDQLSDSTASVYIVPDFFVFELLHSRWTSMGGIPAVSVFENPLFGVDGVLKRVTDVALAIVALSMAAIPMLIIAMAVKITSPGPIFFRQRRYGLDGREILVWKFRSMRTCDNGAVVKQATKGDPRVTRLGNILRRTSLDELPQLFNVITGSMSLVGPRPHATAHNEQYRSRIHGYMLRHKVKPGITGLAQVNGCRGETDTIEKMERRIDWDHRYIRSWSLWLDIRILFKTLRVAWSQPEAY